MTSIELPHQHRPTEKKDGPDDPPYIDGVLQESLKNLTPLPTRSTTVTHPPLRERAMVAVSRKRIIGV
jgi:hypothetical protein